MVSSTIFTPIGPLCVTAEEDAILSLGFGEGGSEENALTLRLRRELDEYFSGTRREFDIPVRPAGTAFMLRVWRELLTIPYGQTRSYGEVAHAIGSPKAARAVGMAAGRNPVAILIPCHRVIGADGSLTGFAGRLEIKKYLLALENETKLK